MTPGIRLSRTTVSMRQARLALLNTPSASPDYEHMLAHADALVDGLEEPERSWMRTEWEYAHVVDRASPTIAALAEPLGLSPADLDALFDRAAQL